METKSPAVAIGLAVHSIIREAGLSLKAFRERSGIPHVTLSRRINGHLCFTFAELVQVAEITGTSVAEIAERAERLRVGNAA